jgi:hypothetical protein
VENLGNAPNHNLIGHNDSAASEPDITAPTAEVAGPPLQRLSPSPYRSLGGYLNYEGWSEQHRFLELDEALRRNASENATARTRPIRGAQKDSSHSADAAPSEGTAFNNGTLSSRRAFEMPGTAPEPAAREAESA